MKFLSHAVKNLSPYVYGEQPKITTSLIKLNTNENPYPPHSSIGTVLKNLDPSKLRFYPDPTCFDLKKVAAKALGVTPQNLVFGNGSDEILSLVFRIFFNPNDVAVFTEYTYSAYKTYADAAGVKYSILPMRKGFDIDLNLLDKIRAKVVFITNPNAPTSIALSPEIISRNLKKHSDKLFIIDEAYVDFAKKNCLSLIKKHKNILIIRTLSKAFSFCGARLGYAVSNPNIISAFEKVKDPYNINHITQVMGSKIFTHYKYYQKNIQKIIKTREMFSNGLKKLKLEVIPSETNFVFVKILDLKAKDLFIFLKKKNIYVRFFDKPGLNEYLRISIGTDKEMKAVLTQIKSFLKKEIKK